MRRHTRLLEMAELSLRELPLFHLVERELDGLVAVLLVRLHLDDWARPCLDHRHSGHHPRFRIEDLGHAELPAENALHTLDLDVDAGGQVEPHQRVDRLRRGAMDVDQALVRPHLELLPRVLVLERAADHGVDVPLGGQGHGPGDRGTGALRVVDDVSRSAVDLVVVVAAKPDADLLLSHVPSSLRLSRPT